MNEKTLSKAVIIIPWYGRLPPYFWYYLRSLEGKSIDVLWVSDIEIGRHPANFKIIPMAFEGLHSLMESKLQTPVSIAKPLRLTDLKPMYGKIFEDYIDQYEYWGFGDCDLVYGKRLNDFLDRVLCQSAYDVISMHKTYLSGPFCLLRNTPQLLNLFQEAENWKEVCAYEGSTRFLFDECGGEFHGQLCSGTMTMEDCSKLCDSFSAVVQRTPMLNCYCEDEITESSLANGEVVEMNEGILTIDEKEISIFHYNLAKIPQYFRYMDAPYEQITHYRIDQTGFYASGFSWATRWLRRPWRISVAAMKSLRKYGLRHALRRIWV